MNNEQRGPVSTSELVGLLSQRLVKGDTLIWREGLPEWTPLDHTDLMDQFDTLASTPAPVPVVAAAAPVAAVKKIEFDLSKELSPTVLHPEAVEDEATALQLAATVTKGAHWFYWIAGLSVLNLIFLAVKAPISMALGLGSTDLIYTLLANNKGGAELPPLTATIVVLDLLLCVVLGLFGWFSEQGNRVVFLIGTFFVALDSLLFLYPFFSMVALAVHGYAIFAMIRGITALGEINQALAEKAAELNLNPPQSTRS